jgi:drug/metabolite transporter (DMT)-like permease
MQKGRMKMFVKYILLAAYIAISTSGMLFLKLGSSGTEFALQNGILSMTMNLKLVVGLCLYVVSFLMYTIVLAIFDLSKISPMAGGIVMLVSVIFGVLILKEKLTLQNIIGIALVIAGVVIMNLKTEAGA